MMRHQGNIVMQFCTATGLLFGRTATAQQFVDYLFPHELLGLSETCFAAVNTTVSSCPGWLPQHAGLDRASFRILGETELQALCGSSCQSDLAKLRSTILTSCTQSSDVMVPGGIAYPATFLTDRFLYAASLSCLKDESTGLYCDAVVSSWPNDTETWTTAQRCHQCQLAIEQQQLASPFGYSEEGAADFASTTSSCQAQTYGYATPTSYGLNSTTAPPPPRPTCASGSYVVMDGDSCNSIAEANGVSTESLISLNGLDLGCNLLPPAGISLCLPRPCKIHELTLADTCESIVKKENITIGQLLAWNPVLSSGCGNINSWRGRFLCASSPLGTITLPDGAKATTAAPIPTNTQGESNTYCGQWYTIATNDSCASISLAFSLSVTDFYFLNPQVDASCSNLWLGYAYCVRAVGNIETYSGYPITVPATTFTRPTTPTETTRAVVWPSLSPRAPGTTDGCAFYEDAWPESIVASDPSVNSCESWASFGDVTVEQLVSWNPSLDVANCALKPGNSYCIQYEDFPPIVTTTSGGGAPEPTPTSPAPPAPTQPGVVESCSKWHVVADGDGCWAISSQYGITLDDFYKLNPGVGSDCSALWLGYAVCVGV